MARFYYTVPEVLLGKVEVSDAHAKFTKAGRLSSYSIELEFPELKLHRTIRTREEALLKPKIEQVLEVWTKQYTRHLDQQHKSRRKEDVDRLNQEAAEAISRLEGTLAHTLDVDDAVDWDSLKRIDAFTVDPNELATSNHTADYIEYADSGEPKSFTRQHPGPAPKRGEVYGEFALVTRLFERSKVENEYRRRVRSYRKKGELCKEENERRKEELARQKSLFDQLADRYYQDQEKRIDGLRERYAVQEVDAIEEYCDLVLESSQYPDFFPSDWEIEYRESNKILVVEYALPAPESLPTTASYSYVASKDEVREKPLADSVKKRLYDSVIYQITLRTIHELFEADVIESIDSVVFNGSVTAVNSATGKEETKTIVTVSAQRGEFMDIDLAKVDPKSTFRHLKGISAAALHGLTPVAPVMTIEKTDKRFIEARDVASGIDSSTNLAAMDWEDFEHLVTGLFEQEFAVGGGEVKVTQASADGGVDAVAFDPDPIRGGKIVIQAKRYTNTVGVAAVRDLYGTVLNEGATKGILVTTSDYGPDSYEFAKDKPLTLLNGSNLLSLLEKHGHEARIDVAEAKKLMSGE